ncbi:MAG: hypothetical protein DHS20C19_11820 [Acidimicrobiales bacterium]|nr:MAG: hypothetical protein DHS20C19_11820 [Acidimicrobiales bacterium]
MFTVVLVSTILATMSPIAAQDDTTGEVEWVLTIPRTAGNTTTPRGFAVDEAAGEIVAILNVDGSVTFGGGDVAEATYTTGTYALRISLDGELRAVVALDAPAERLVITADGDLLVTSRDRAIARVAPDGTVRWERHIDGVGNLIAVELTDGTIALAGRFDTTIVLGDGEPAETTLDPGDGRLGSAFVAWLAPDGALVDTALWEDVSDIAIAAGPDRGLRVLGVATTTLTLGEGPAETTIEVVQEGTSLSQDTILGSYDGARELEWAVGTGVSFSGDVIDLATSDDGASVMWLSSNRTVVMGARTPAETTAEVLVDDGFGDDHLLARYSADGEFEWVHVVGSAEAGEEEYRSLGVRPSGEIIASGDVGPGSVTFGGDQPPRELGDQSRLGVGVYQPDGTLVWTAGYGSESFDVSWGSALLADGDAIVFALTSGPTTFGFPPDETPVADADSWLVARLDGFTPPPPTTTTTTTLAPTTTQAAPDEPEPTDDGTPEPDVDADGGAGGTIAIVIIVLVALGGAGYLVARGRGSADDS